MFITDALRGAADEHQIFFLLNAYVEAVHYCDPLHRLPGFITALPIAGLADVRGRAEQLRRIVESPAGADPAIQSVLAEALGILTAAAERLETLSEEKASPLLEAA